MENLPLCLSFFLFYLKIYLLVLERQIHREEDLLSNDSLPKQLQQLELSQSEARSQELFWVSHAGAGSQDLGPSSTAFPGYKQGAGWEVGLLELELAPIWDPGACKARTLTTVLSRRAPC